MKIGVLIIVPSLKLIGIFSMTIYKLSNDQYKLIKHAKQVTGNRAQIIAHMLLLNVSETEIELGLVELDNPEMNRACYGFGYSGNGPMFIFSDKLAS